MNLRSEKHSRFLIIVSLLIVLVGCEKRPDGLLSRNKMTDFLYELHKLDGTLMANGFGNTDDRENVYYYNALLEKHGITKARFDSSVVWYSNHPKTYEKIYVEVMARLNILDEAVKSGKFHPVDTFALRNSKREMWPLKTAYLISPDSAKNRLAFSIIDSQLRWNDRYTLRLLQQLWSDKDSSNHKRLIFRIHYSDSITDSIYTLLHPDSILRRYTLTFRAKRQLPIEKISGELLWDTTSSQKFYAKIDSISFMRHYDELAQDSIKTLIEQIQQDANKDSIKSDSSKTITDTLKPVKKEPHTVKTIKEGAVKPVKTQKIHPRAETPKLLND
ncbi:MAG: DUF4296 domain-containing protein [Paludibacteraceae bacterium]|nr:DUF4296 domain-containing protein [Paludibacteraceae bacterium]